jgi:hypothetical protein
MYLLYMLFFFLYTLLLDAFAKLQRATIKADSHIACRAHAAPMPFSCHAVR